MQTKNYKKVESKQYDETKERVETASSHDTDKCSINVTRIEEDTGKKVKVFVESDAIDVDEEVFLVPDKKEWFEPLTEDDAKMFYRICHDLDEEDYPPKYVAHIRKQIRNRNNGKVSASKLDEVKSQAVDGEPFEL